MMNGSKEPGQDPSQNSQPDSPSRSAGDWAAGLVVSPGAKPGSIVVEDPERPDMLLLFHPSSAEELTEVRHLSDLIDAWEEETGEETTHDFQHWLEVHHPDLAARYQVGGMGGIDRQTLDGWEKRISVRQHDAHPGVLYVRYSARPAMLLRFVPQSAKELLEVQEVDRLISRWIRETGERRQDFQARLESTRPDLAAKYRIASDAAIHRQTPPDA